jgi:hypothetical protein
VHLIKLEFNMEFQDKIINAVVASGQERPYCLTSFQSRKETVNGKHRGVNELGKDLALDAFPFLKACLKIINRDDWVGYKVSIRISRIYDRPRYLFSNVTCKITPQLATFEKNNHILGLRMIRSGTIRNISDEMCELMP